MLHLNRPTRLGLKLALFVVVVIVFVRPIAKNFVKAFDDLHDVHVVLLGVALALQAVSLFAYASVTHAALGGRDSPVSIWRVVRIQMSTRAFGGIVPAGAAAGPALGYRLLTRSGVPGREAGFALGAAGTVSAVILNLILWIGLLNAFTEVLEKRDAERTDAGIVRFKHYGINQNDKLIFEGERIVLMKRRAAWIDR